MTPNSDSSSSTSNRVISQPLSEILSIYTKEHILGVGVGVGEQRTKERDRRRKEKREELLPPLLSHQLYSFTAAPQQNKSPSQLARKRKHRKHERDDLIQERITSNSMVRGVRIPTFHFILSIPNPHRQILYEASTKETRKNNRTSHAIFFLKKEERGEGIEFRKRDR